MIALSMKAIFMRPGSSEYPENKAGFMVLYENRASVVSNMDVRLVEAEVIMKMLSGISR